MTRYTYRVPRSVVGYRTTVERTEYVRRVRETKLSMQDRGRLFKELVDELEEVDD